MNTRSNQPPQISDERRLEGAGSNRARQSAMWLWAFGGRDGGGAAGAAVTFHKCHCKFGSERRLAAPTNDMCVFVWGRRVGVFE